MDERAREMEMFSSVESLKFQLGDRGISLKGTSKGRLAYYPRKSISKMIEHWWVKVASDDINELSNTVESW